MDIPGIRVYSPQIELPKDVIMTFVLFIKHKKRSVSLGIL